MNKIFTLAALASFSLLTSVELKAQTVSLTTLGSASTQNFNTLNNTAGSTTNNLTITGWFMTETGGGARDNEQYGVDTGGSNIGDTYSYGTAGNTDRAIGAVQSGTLVSIIGASFTNNTGGTITSLDIAYTGEQWRIGNTAASRDDRMDFSYNLTATDLTTGTWTDVNAGDFINPIKTNGTAIALDGNNAANKTAITFSITGLNIANGATFWIRWNDLNASGADDGLAIDDFSITPQGTMPDPDLTVNDVSQVEGNSGTTTFTYTVSLSAPAGAGGVTFDIATADGTGTDADDDYDSQTLTSQTITAGNSTYNFNVTVNADANCEANETFFVNVTNVTGATVTDGQGQGTITNDEVLVADDPADVTACDSYELPPLTVGNYFTGAGGTGAPLSAGNMITSTQTIFVYATSGTCTDENDFEITINTTPVVDDPADVSACGTYELPALTVGNYFTGAGGAGSALSAGDDITSSQTIYVYAAVGTCADENSFDVTIKTVPTITNTVSASRCGTGAITLEATPSAGTIDWFMAATGGTTGYTGSTINLSLSSTKTYYAEASDNGCVSASRTAVTATIDFCSQVQTSQCGATLATPTTAIIADAAIGATHYRFEITNGTGGVQTVTKTTRTLYLANFTYYYDSTYAIRVAVSNDGTTFSAYGASCNITAPAIPASKVQASQCGATLATPTTAIIADAVTGATHYRFEIDGGAQYVTKTTRTLYQANFVYAYNTTYAIRVAASADGTNFGAYGASCNVTTSAAPTTKVQASQCGTTLATVSTAIIADAITGATHYRFEIDGGAQYVTKTTRTLYLGNFTYTSGSTYAIRVTYSTDGTNFFPYGSSCNITAPSSFIEQDENMYEATGDLMTDISVETFPNPNNGDFTISSTREGVFNIINELGQLIQTVAITKEGNFEVRVSGLESGVYFVTGTINNEVITKKITVLK